MEFKAANFILSFLFVCLCVWENIKLFKSKIADFNAQCTFTAMYQFCILI